LKYAIQFAKLKVDSLLPIKLVIIVHFVYHIISFLVAIMFKVILEIEMWFLGSNLCDTKTPFRFNFSWLGFKGWTLLWFD